MTVRTSTTRRSYHFDREVRSITRSESELAEAQAVRSEPVSEEETDVSLDEQRVALEDVGQFLNTTDWTDLQIDECDSALVSLQPY